LITLTSGVAVHDTLQEFGLKPDIKWVNDVLVNDKKISGILAETIETNDGIAVIVGIGINLESSNFPPEIADIATSLESETKAVPNGDLVESLTKYLTYFYGVLHSENGPAEIINEWRRRSSYFSGKAVRVVVENETITGVTDGLEPNGALRVRRENGELSIIQAGDVEQLRSEL
jgi:BirA family biotin operon repressor/biotin-[acetyl-CoA-carboxylase] ligase